LAYPARIATTPVASVVLFVLDAVAFVAALHAVARMFFRMTVWEEGEYDWDYNRQGLFKSGDM
jgi:hypothetical protein